MICARRVPNSGCSAAMKLASKWKPCRYSEAESRFGEMCQDQAQAPDSHKHGGRMTPPPQGVPRYHSSPPPARPETPGPDESACPTSAVTAVEARSSPETERAERQSASSPELGRVNGAKPTGFELQISSVSQCCRCRNSRTSWICIGYRIGNRLRAVRYRNETYETD